MTIREMYGKRERIHHWLVGVWIVPCGPGESQGEGGLHVYCQKHSVFWDIISATTVFFLYTVICRDSSKPTYGHYSY